MGAFDFIKGMFGGSKRSVDQLALLGTDESLTKQFLGLLSRSRIWLLGNESELESDGLTQQKLRSQIEQGMEATARIESSDQVKFHTFRLDEHIVLPFFTSQKFIGTYVENSGVEKVTAFQGFELASGILLRDDLLRVPAVMNPLSSHTRYFSADDKVALAKLLTARKPN